MTIPNLEQIIAEAIDDVQFKLDADELEAATASVVAAIRDSGLAVIALPEPSEYLPGKLPSWSRAISVAVDHFNEIVVGRTWWINRHEARDLAAALLAAAQVAERNNP